MSRPAILLALLALSASLTACGLGPGRTPSNVALTVTDNFGTRVLRETTTPNNVGSETVMQLLMRNATVTTRYGGGFVQSINGLAGDATAAAGASRRRRCRRDARL